MGSNLDRWEKDPFFLAAEEVQESADRMESTFRTLIHASKQPSVWNSEAVRTDLQTAIATTKWQLEEFERAAESSYGNSSADDMKERHRDFISAIESQISRVESSCNDNDSLGKPPRPWVRLDEGERNELELFLSGSTAPADEQQRGRRKQKVEAKDAKFSGHRRAASASADISSWKITVEDNVSPRGKIQYPPRKIPSFSGLLNTLESASKMKWPKNGYTKLKLIDHHQRQEPDANLSETQPLTRGSVFFFYIEIIKYLEYTCDDICWFFLGKRFLRNTRKVVGVVQMNSTTNDFMDGMVPFNDSSNGHRIICCIVGAPR